MTIIVNRPKINVQEKLNELDRPVGIGGQQVLQSNTVRDAQNVLGVGRKNILLNSQFHINQRGEDVASGVTISGVNDYYTVDRWNEYHNGGVTRKVTINYNVQLPDGTMCNSYKSEYVSGTASWMHPVQQVPFEDWMYGKTFAVSTWVKTSIPGFRIRVCDTTSCYLIGPVIPDDGEWHYVTGTVTFPDHGLNSSAVTQWQPAFGSGSMSSGDYIEFACMQVEVGEVSTPFEWRSYQDELQLCKRYYHKLNGGTSGIDQDQYAPITFWMESASAMKGVYEFPVEMRDVPTVTVAGSWSIDGGTSGNPSVTLLNNHQNTAGKKTCRFEFLGSFQATDGGLLAYATNGTTYIEFDAEV